MTKILIVDDDLTTSFILGKNLTNQGYSVETADSAVIGAELMKKEEFALVITDVYMPEISGLDFLLWIRKHSPKSQVIVMTANSSLDLKNFVNLEGVLKFFEKPVNLNELNKFIKENLKKGSSGRVQDINLFDYIQIIILSGKQKLISVTDKITQQTGKLFIKNGNIIHAETGKFSGQEAFNAIMIMRNGAFSEINWYDPEKETISIPSTLLLQDAVKIIEQDNNPASGEKDVKAIAGKILIVDDDPITPLIIAKSLSLKGYFVETADSAIAGAELMKKEHFSLVITDLNMPEVNGLEFLLWIKQNSPKSLVIIITAGGSSEIKKFANQKGALGYYEKPIDLKELDNFIQRNVINKGFSGEIHDIDLLDFIQIIAFSGKNKLISVNDLGTNKSGLIYIEDGQIIHAENSELTGEDAFYSIIKFKGGIFSDLPWVEPDERTINVPITHLLMKAMKITSRHGKEENGGFDGQSESKALSVTTKIKAKSRYLEKALEQREAIEKYMKEKDPLKKLTIYESGVALGIVIGRSTKDDVISIMKDYSKVSTELQRENQIFLFDDISLTILFNEEDIVEEFTFGKLYKGETGLGIKIDDPMEKAIKVYGKPKTGTVKGAVWDNIALFSQDNKYISSIRIRNLSFFTSEKEKLVNTPPKILSQEKPEPVKQEPVADLKFKLSGKNDTLSKTTPRKPLNNSETGAEKASEPGKEQQSDKELYTIHESGRVLNIIIGGSTPEEVHYIMEKYSKSKGETKYSRNILSYEDISVNILFDHNRRVKEINLGINFPGETEKGLKIGDSLKKAIDIYGAPQYSSDKSLVWAGFAVFFEKDETISVIRLREK